MVVMVARSTYGGYSEEGYTVVAEGVEAVVWRNDRRFEICRE